MMAKVFLYFMTRKMCRMLSTTQSAEISSSNCKTFVDWQIVGAYSWFQTDFSLFQNHAVCDYVSGVRHWTIKDHSFLLCSIIQTCLIRSQLNCVLLKGKPIFIQSNAYWDHSTEAQFERFHATLNGGLTGGYVQKQVQHTSPCDPKQTVSHSENRAGQTQSYKYLTVCYQDRQCQANLGSINHSKFLEKKNLQFSMFFYSLPTL